MEKEAEVGVVLTGSHDEDHKLDSKGLDEIMDAVHELHDEEEDEEDQHHHHHHHVPHLHHHHSQDDEEDEDHDTLDHLLPLTLEGEHHGLHHHHHHHHEDDDAHAELARHHHLHHVPHLLHHLHHHQQQQHGAQPPAPGVPRASPVAGTAHQALTAVKATEAAAALVHAAQQQAMVQTATTTTTTTTATASEGVTAGADLAPHAKVVKRGRGGRRAGAGRKRKSDAIKSEAGGESSESGNRSAAVAADSPGKLLEYGSSQSLSLAPESNPSSGSSGSNGPSAHKKKRVSYSSLEETDSYKKNSRQLRFGYTILYVKDVEATVEFYERAFGLRRRFIHDTKQYAELETGATALSFASNELARNNLAPVEFLPNDPSSHPPGMEIAFASSDVHRDYRRALEAGAKSVSAPKTLPWGQVVAYVRDLNGVLVEIASELKTPLRK